MRRVHGALMPLILMPGGVALARALDVFTIQWRFALPMVPDRDGDLLIGV